MGGAKLGNVRLVVVLATSATRARRTAFTS